MNVGRKVFVGLAWLFVLAVAIQFLLAGLGVLGGGSMEPHRQWGFVVLHLVPILMLIAAIVSPLGTARDEDGPRSVSDHGAGHREGPGPY